MIAKDISFIIPVFNRPEEVNELLQSLAVLNGSKDFEVVIVEDGSDIKSDKIVDSYKSILNIAYFFKPNSGPGDSRNFGMKHAKRTYFIILDSDCVLPKQYLNEVLASINNNYVDCFGGPDTAHKSFTNIQKAINFAMTSFISTGGIRGKKNSVNKFQPRSFNMGISKVAFEATNGFGNIHPGEDPDLSIRLTKLGFKTSLFEKAFVYHKRRISWGKFYKQVYKFGMVRPILNVWHPETKRITYWFPSLFCLGLLLALLLLLFNLKIPVMLYIAYFLLAFIIAFFKTKNVLVAFLSLYAICIQFLGYGLGFLKSTIKLTNSKANIEARFPQLFFKSS
ncbi:MAG: glycosyltransferase [Flavobacteriaceae bacterium]